MVNEQKKAIYLKLRKKWAAKIKKAGAGKTRSSKLYRKTLKARYLRWQKMRKARYLKWRAFMAKKAGNVS